MKINEIENTLAEILQNYNHPLFDTAFSMIDDKDFYTVDEGDEDGKQPRIKQSNQ